MKAVCFTGHREIPDSDIKLVKEGLYRNICALADEGYTEYYTGGASGFDTIAAHAVLYLRETRNPEIKLHIILPYSGKRLDARSRQANSITAVADEYYTGCMHERDRALVDAAEVCVCYLRKSRGGTAYTVRYAGEQGLRVVRI